MNPLKKAIDAYRSRKPQKVASQEINGQICYNALCSNAENVFAQMRPLVDALKMVVPYGVGRNGARLGIARTPELAALQYPNEEMGWAEFADLMFSTWLTEKELNIHVWRNQRGQIYGYSVLPVGSRHTVGGKEYFQCTLDTGELVQYSPDEVMTLRFSRNPHQIDSGLSPGIASMVWAQIDDVMAQYQLGHFENGAVPAYITIIRASTKDKYLEKRKEMQEGFHGARNKGKTLFLWRQMLDDGTEKDEIEVKTIQGSNASLAIKEIMAIVNDKINKAFGVSEFILGNDSSAKYDNAELSQQQFMRRRVYPALYTFWSQFQHELDRILGGLGYAIQFDLEIPELTERAKVKAETKKIEAETSNLYVQREKLQEEKRKLEEEEQKLREEQASVRSSTSQTQLATLITAITAGATPAAALKSLNLGAEWQDIANDIYASQQTTANEPATTETIKNTSHDHICSHCEHSHDAKEPYEPQFTDEEQTERSIYEQLMLVVNSVVKSLRGSDIILTEEQRQQVVEEILQKITEVAQSGANAGAHEIQAQVLSTTAQEIAGVLENGGFKLSEAFEAKMRERVEMLVQRLEESTKEKGREILNAKRETPLNANQLAKELQDIVPKWRAELIARNETVYAFRAGHLENDKNMAKQYGLKLRKIWRAHKDGRACEICKAMDGQEVDLDDAFPDSVESSDGVRYSWEQDSWNEHGEIPSAHVRCRCYYETVVVND